MDIKQWWDPYKIGLILPFHRCQTVPWNINIPVESTSSNGFEFWYMIWAYRMSYNIQNTTKQDYRHDVLMNYGRGSMAHKVISTTFKKYRKRKIDRRMLILVFAIKDIMIREHYPIVKSFLSLDHTSKCSGLDMLRRSSKGKNNYYITLLYNIPPTEYVRHKCSEDNKMCILCKKLNIKD